MRARVSGAEFYKTPWWEKAYAYLFMAVVIWVGATTFVYHVINSDQTEMEVLVNIPWIVTLQWEDARK